MAIDQNDHDLLIALNTKMEMALSSLAILTGKVAILETRDGRDSEKMAAIQRDIAENYANARSVPALKVEISDLKDRVDSLEKKSNAWDMINSLGVGIIAVLAWIFGK